jgi:hypothetical protein
MAMDTNCCPSPQLETLSSTIAAMIRTVMLNHFRLINGSWDQATRLNTHAAGEM